MIINYWMYLIIPTVHWRSRGWLEAPRSITLGLRIFLDRIIQVSLHSCSHIKLNGMKQMTTKRKKRKLQQVPIIGYKLREWVSEWVCILGLVCIKNNRLTWVGNLHPPSLRSSLSYNLWISFPHWPYRDSPGCTGQSHREYLSTSSSSLRFLDGAQIPLEEPFDSGVRTGIWKRNLAVVSSDDDPTNLVDERSSLLGTLLSDRW